MGTNTVTVNETEHFEVPDTAMQRIWQLLKPHRLSNRQYKKHKKHLTKVKRRNNA